MNWEETIIYLRSTAFFRELIKESYLEEDLVSNAERFEKSEEFLATLKEIKLHCPTGKKLLDVGAGNGIATAAFTKNGFHVTALEPDTSATVGTEAIRSLLQLLNLSDVKVIEATAEKIPFGDNTFDIVYVRQAMHHAHDLDLFISECSRVLKPGGILFTVRDHVIYGEKDKRWFLKKHPLHKFYGGENAFKDTEYRKAMKSAGLKVIKTFKHFDSIINFAPQTTEEIEQLPNQFKHRLDLRAIQKFGNIAKFGPFRYIYRKAVALKYGGPLDEKRIPGRLYSYLAKK